jgi:3-oxoacyl-[acyl-carrier-protein] synthase II
MKTNLSIEAIGIISSLGVGAKESLQGLKSKPIIQSFKLSENLSLPVSQVQTLKKSQREEKAFFFADQALKCIEEEIGQSLLGMPKIAILCGCTKGESANISQELKRETPDFQTYQIASSNSINQKLSKKYHIPYIPVSSAACATGAQVIQKASILLDEKKYDKIILCMTEASLTPEMIGAFYQLGVLTKNKNGTAPFDKNHHGFHMGEGAVALLLSKKKMPNSNSKIIGAATATDAEHFTTFPSGPKLVWETIQSLCKSCDIKLSEISHVNLHGTGTAANDSMELALTQLLIQANHEISFTALKPFTGHLLGASGLSEFVISLISAQNNWLPPILNNNSPENSLPLPFILEPTGRNKEINYFLNLSYGLGSTIGVILGKK